MNEEVIIVNSLTKKFNNITAVKNISFKIKKGTIIGLLGPNGCGKSTTIGMMLGLIKPSSGIVLINNQNIENNRTNLLEKMNFIFLKEGDDPDSYIKEKGKDAFIKLADEATSFSDYFLQTVKKQDDLSSIEGRSMVAQFAIPLVNKILNPTLKEAYISELSHICDLDFEKLLTGNALFSKRDYSKQEEIKKVPSTIMRKSVLGVFTALIQHPTLATDRVFELIKKDSRFLFLNDVRNFYKENLEAAPSILFEQIENEKIKNLFGEALVSEIKLSKDDGRAMIQDCIELISKSEKDRDEILKEKYNMQEISSAEKRELQQLILKKEELSEEEKELIKQIIQFLSKILTSEIAKKIIKEDEGTIGAKVDGREENSKPEKTLKSEKYIILTNEYDVVEASKHKKTMKDDPIHKSQLIRVFQDMLQTECKGFRTVSDTGKRLDSKSLVKAFQGYPNVFLEKTSDKDIDTAIGVLVDASGSMGGIPMALAAKASYELASALQSFPIALEVAYFQTKWSPSTYRKLMKKYPDIFKKGSPPYQSWEEGYRVWPNGLFIVKDFNQSINERRNYFKGMEDVAQGANADGESLLEFSYRLERRPESKKIMIVLSDGYPACGVGYPAEDDFLRQSINNIIDRGIDLGGIGILSDCVEKFYPICSVVNDINQLPSSLSDLCNKMLRSSMRRAS